MLKRRLLRTGAVCAMLLTCMSVGSLSPTVVSATPKQTVTMWSWFTQSDMKFAVKAFEAAHPNVTVNYTYYNYAPQFLTALKTAAATGTLPDIIGLQPGSLTQQYRAVPCAPQHPGSKVLGCQLDQAPLSRRPQANCNG